MSLELSCRGISRRGFGVAFIAGLASFAFVVPVASTTARADMIELDFTGAGQSSGGVGVYPYNFNFNGETSPNYQLMCDDFTHEIMAPKIGKPTQCTYRA